MDYGFCRHLMGDALSTLTVNELKQLNNRLERGITRIRSKKLLPTRVESLLDRNKGGGNRSQFVKNEGKSKENRSKDAGERLRGKGKCLPLELWRMRTVTRAFDDGDERNVLVRVCNGELWLNERQMIESKEEKKRGRK
ncbi:hypothetical protein V8G54_035731 [Vigna mungo]|uniref:K-box domain-containing protein n=1 Tax=Vigna mungo TaxID=3915 RepID=A0AAQ3MFK8_VIGMU